MNFIEHAKEGLRHLYFSKLRSLLALLGILVGTASVVAMVSGGELATNEALKEFKSLGTDLLAVTVAFNTTENATTAGEQEGLTLPQTLSFQKYSAILQLAPYTQLFYPVFYEGQSINSVVLGVTDSFASILKMKLIAGRFVSLIDQYSFYCVIGQHVYQALKTFSSKNPLGETLQIGNHLFVIAGIADMQPENNFVNADINNAVMVPLLTSTLISRYAIINHILFQLEPNANVEEVENYLSAQVQQKQSDQQLIFQSAKELINKMQDESHILTLLLGLIGSISLIVGGIGVMNIMLVSVMERKREIGIRLAIGATRWDIAALFLWEAIVLSFIGGTLGVMLGILITYGIALCWHWEFILFFWPPFTGFFVSLCIGIFFGFYPAYLASRLTPIEALRAD